jgi:flavin-dependent dehydrogenase
MRGFADGNVARTKRLPRSPARSCNLPEFAERLRGAKRETRLVGAPTPNFFRKPYGPGWALVGDVGYLKDPITAQGIGDAFRDAEACALGLHKAFTGTRRRSGGDVRGCAALGRSPPR